MSLLLSDFLRTQAERSLRYLLRETEELTAEDAFRYASPHWPAHKWGIGQNGSVAGLVYHVAAWKVLTLPLFEPGGKFLLPDTLDTLSPPAPDDWRAVRNWLKETGERWNERLAQVTEDEISGVRDWGGQSLTLALYIAEMIEHDVQHAAQIEYLKQRLLSEKES